LFWSPEMADLVRVDLFSNSDVLSSTLRFACSSWSMLLWLVSSVDLLTRKYPCWGYCSKKESLVSYFLKDLFILKSTASQCL
jgi:hypothetical protein